MFLTGYIVDVADNDQKPLARYRCEHEAAVVARFGVVQNPKASIFAKVNVKVSREDRGLVVRLCD
jgi:hypothetical protein